MTNRAKDSKHIQLKQSNKFKYIIFFDCEYTCWENSLASGWSDPEYPSEIIQIGLVVYEVKKNKILKNYVSFVKPCLNQKLSKYCLKLLKFSQSTIDKSPNFKEIVNSINSIIKNIPINEYFICSWGDDFNRITLNSRINNTIDPFSNCFRLNLMTEYNNVLKLSQFISSRDAIKKLIKYDTKISRHDALEDSIELIDLYTISLNLNDNV